MLLQALGKVYPVVARTHAKVAVGIAVGTCGIHLAIVVNGIAGVGLAVGVAVKGELVLLYIVLKGAGKLVGGSGGGMNPAAMMTGMIMGGAVGQQMAGMMNNMGNAMNAQGMPSQPGGPSVPPPPPVSAAFYVAINGQQAGPFDMAQLGQLATQGSLTAQTLVWKNGMPSWTAAGMVPELASLFGMGGTPPVPPVPPAF